MDYLPLRNQRKLIDQFPSFDLLLQTKSNFPIGLEWVYARKAGHELWEYCMTNFVDEKIPWPVMAAGPVALWHCLNHYMTIKMAPGVAKNITVTNQDGFTFENIRLLERKHINPMGHDWFRPADCRKFFNATSQFWESKFHNSPCRNFYMETGSFALTVYSGSWH